MRTVNGKIRIASLSAGLLKRSASGFACAHVTGMPLLDDWFGILKSKEDKRRTLLPVMGV